MNKKIKKLNGGYSLIETLFYVALFAVLSIAIINSLIYMVRYFKETKINRELSSAATIVEKISREIRQSNNINNISATSIEIVTEGDGGVATKTLDFTLSGTNLQLLENNSLVGNLNSQNISVTAVTFGQITTVAGKAVSIAITVRSNSDVQNRTVDFHDTVVIRGLY